MGNWKHTAALLALFLGAAAGACLAQDLPANGDYAAKVISLTGDVSVLRDSGPWALNAGDSIKMRQVIVTGPDGHAVFEVSDGSTFEVFPSSNVVFRNNPPSWRDLLDVLAGRIKVHIQKWGGEPNPNRIHTPAAVISVRGTTFDVAVNEDDATTDVAVEEGVVDVRHLLHPGPVKTLNAGESIRVYRDQSIAQSMIDKGAVARQVLRGITDALYTMLLNRGPGGAIGAPIPGGGVGNKGGPPPPPPPPPPPAPHL